MKFYNVKITEEERRRLCEILGVSSGILNLTRGVFRVDSKEAVDSLEKKFKIDNVNWKSFEEFKNGDKSGIKGHKESIPNISDESEPNLAEQIPSEPEINGVKVKNLSTEERISIIGNKVKKGSIVRVKGEEKTFHVLITEVSGMWYAGYKIILGTEHYNPETDVILEKNVDVIYRNLTYKAKVRVIPELITGLKRENFIFGAGGLIVGKVFNKDTFNKLLKFAKENEASEEEQKVDLIQEEQIECAEEEDKETSKIEIPTEAQQKGKEETLNQQNKKEVSNKYFEELVKSVSSMEELLSVIDIENSMLADAIRICVKNKNSNMKKLLPALQEKYTKKKMTQNALKNQLNDELAEWCKRAEYTLKEETVSYFLRVVVKGIRVS